MAIRNNYGEVIVMEVEDWRDDLQYPGDAGEFDRLVADGYSAAEAFDMVVNGEV
jgi:hypothetical protein